ncbi:MAG: outer membrane lipoprotein carrier protein LolA [Desulfoprunum sp.]|nr:outer membrane lipoprotein carrier protein LolA [Desulfoprunum sp.]
MSHFCPTRHPSFLAFFLFGLLLILPALSQAAESYPEAPGAVAARLQARYDAMRSLSFIFVQQTEGQMTGRPRKGGGKAYFLKTGGLKRMRWNYDSPERQILVSDGKTFSMYFDNLHQMIVSPAKKIEEDMTYSFFTGSGKLVEDFMILGANKNMVEADDDKELRIIQLVPKNSESQVQDIHLWITADSLIRRIEIRDQFDTRTILTLSDLKADFVNADDEKAIAEMFTFSPPEGTEIIHQ